MHDLNQDERKILIQYPLSSYEISVLLIKNIQCNIVLSSFFHKTLNSKIERIANVFLEFFCRNVVILVYRSLVLSISLNFQQLVMHYYMD